MYRKILCEGTTFIGDGNYWRNWVYRTILQVLEI